MSDEFEYMLKTMQEAATAVDRERSTKSPAAASRHFLQDTHVVV